MACAIFNPFCCCTAGVLSLGDVAETAATHGCCQSQSSDLPAEGDVNQKHDMSECPHAALKDYEPASHQGMGAASDSGTRLPALLAVCELLAVEPVTQVRYLVIVATVSHAPPLPFAQVYCVYRV